MLLNRLNNGVLIRQSGAAESTSTLLVSRSRWKDLVQYTKRAAAVRCVESSVGLYNRPIRVTVNDGNVSNRTTNVFLKSPISPLPLPSDMPSSSSSSPPPSASEGCVGKILRKSLRVVTVVGGGGGDQEKELPILLIRTSVLLDQASRASVRELHDHGSRTRVCRLHCGMCVLRLLCLYSISD